MTPLPSFGLSCEADGKPAAGIPILVTVKMNQRNDFHIVAGLTDRDGKLDVTWQIMQSEIETSLAHFPADYAPLSETEHTFSDVIEVHAMTIPEIEAALRAYDLYHNFSPYPPDYRMNLEQGYRNLLAQSPRRLDVRVRKDATPNSQPTVRIETGSVPFPVMSASASL